MLSTDDMISIAAQIEGHPDNILPTFVGGMTAGAIVDGKVKYVHIDPPHQLKCCAFVPNFQLSTRKARAVLPKEVPFKDAVFNASRRASWWERASGQAGPGSHSPGGPAAPALQKGAHPRLRAIIAAAERNGALGCCLSGAGPTMIAFLDKDYRQFVQRMRLSIDSLGLPNRWEVKLLDICFEGATWEL